MGRAPCCDKTKVRSGPWSPAEDSRLVAFIQKHGHPNWRALPKQAGLLRCGKSCRLRWINYLSPDVKRGDFTPEEEQTIIDLHNSIGNKWSKIAACLPGRTDNEIKNVWNTHLKKRAKMNGLLANSSSRSTTSISEVNMEETLLHPGDDHGSGSGHANQVSDAPSYAELGFSQFQELLEFPAANPDTDFWAMLVEALDLEEQPCDNVQADNEVEFSKWLTNLEQELGLTSSDNGGDTASPLALDYDYSDPLLWPYSPVYHGI